MRYISGPTQFGYRVEITHKCFHHVAVAKTKERCLENMAKVLRDFQKDLEVKS